MERAPLRWVRPIERDRDGFTKMDGVLNQVPADLSDRFCGVPFDLIDIQSAGRLFLCCPTWLPTTAGTLSEMGLVEAFNSPAAQEIRRSVLDGSFRYCHKVVCPYIQQGTLPGRADIADSRHRGFVERGQVSGLVPTRLSLCYDESCNLSCPSCRTTPVSLTSGPEYEERKAIQDKVVEFAFGAPHNRILLLTITGSGDPFGSKLFRDLLFGLDGSQYPNLRVDLHTNGVAFTASAWNKLERLHRNLRDIVVSVDAGNERQYQITRRGGHWQTLMSNLEFLGARRREGAFRALNLNFVVQRDNFKGIPEYIRIGKRIGADCCLLSLLNDWGTWTAEEFRARAVWSVDHPDFEEFLRVMSDPILADPIADLGNTIQYRRASLDGLEAVSRLP